MGVIRHNHLKVNDLNVAYSCLSDAILVDYEARVNKLVSPGHRLCQLHKDKHSSYTKLKMNRPTILNHTNLTGPNATMTVREMSSTPEPYYEDEWVRIYLGSCQHMVKVAHESIDLILTDPVYDALDHYQFLVSLRDSLKPEAALLVWSGVRFLDKALDALRSGYTYRGLFAFVNQTTGHMIGKMINKTHFLVWLDKDGQSRMLDYLPNGYLSVGWGMEKDYHRWVKNPKFISRAIVAFSNPGAVILDPFMGSGTVAICAKKLNRKYIGYEVEERYCRIAAKKCSQQVFRLNV